MLAHLKRAPPQSRQSWYVSARRTYDRVGRKRRECCKANPPHLSPSALSHICNTVWLAEGLTSFKYWLPTYTGFPLHIKIFGVGKKTSDYINVRGTKSFNQLYPLLTITQATLKISNCKISICMTHWGKCKLRDYLGFVSNMHRMPSVSTLKKETMARSGSCASRN